MTSLIDVIFLLLLFFMLSSTFSRFAEVDLTAASGGGTASDTPPLFLQLASDGLTLNGTAQTLDDLPETLSRTNKPQVLVSLKSGVTAQRLTDLLVTLRNIDGISVTVLEAS